MLPTAPPEPPPLEAEARRRRLDELLARPPQERRREYKYRFGQSVVFGLPVVALQLYGRQLGPTDSQRWVSLLQALLAGWVVYVNLGMLFEALVRRRMNADFIVAATAAAINSVSLVSAAHGIVTARLLWPLGFHVSVIILAIYSAARWMRYATTTSV
jgi:hypothetical protein